LKKFIYLVVKKMILKIINNVLLYIVLMINQMNGKKEEKVM